jgi:hypothetical protein
MTALGNNAHIFVKPDRRDALKWCCKTAIDAGLRPVKHPGHPYYLIITGGQVFTITPLS